MKNSKITYLIFSIIIGILISISPVFVTGAWYNTSKVMGDLLVAEFILRVLAIMVGLVVIYNGLKHFYITKVN